MKFQILFSGKNKKIITNLSSAELAQRVVKVNYPDADFLVHYMITFKIQLPWEERKKERDKETITKTYLYNFDPLKPHVYTVKLGFTGVYIIFLISA